MGATSLYTPAMLAAALRLGEHAFDLVAEQEGAVVVERDARPCGSRICLAVTADPEGVVTAVGANVHACAVGQAAAATMLDGAKGQRHADVEGIIGAIDAWLHHPDAPLPRWPGFAVLEPARDKPTRHGALRLPFAALADALAQAPRAAGVSR